MEVLGVSLNPSMVSSGEVADIEDDEAVFVIFVGSVGVIVVVVVIVGIFNDDDVLLGLVELDVIGVEGVVLGEMAMCLAKSSVCFAISEARSSWKVRRDDIQESVVDLTVSESDGVLTTASEDNEAVRGTDKMGLVELDVGVDVEVVGIDFADEDLERSDDTQDGSEVEADVNSGKEEEEVVF